MTGKPTTATQLRFETDLEIIAGALVEAFDLKFDQKHPTLSSPIHRWLDFRYRYIPARPRQILRSDWFTPANLSALPRDAQQGFSEFEQRLSRGDDINPYQGRGLKFRNDTSAEVKPDQHVARTDLLFADWGITHVHLSTAPLDPRRYHSKPADYLVFFRIVDATAYLIDIRRHPTFAGFADDTLFGTMARSWPELVEPYKVRGVTLERALSGQERSDLRLGNLNAFVQHEGQIYVGVGQGTSSAGASFANTLILDRILVAVRRLADETERPDGQFRKDLSLDGVPPMFTLGCYDLGLAIKEEMTGSVFYIAPYSQENAESYISQLNEAFCPMWAAKQLCAS